MLDAASRMGQVIRVMAAKPPNPSGHLTQGQRFVRTPAARPLPDCGHRDPTPVPDSLSAATHSEDSAAPRPHQVIDGGVTYQPHG